ncbi:MAG: TatD family hydrolase [Candidatus Dadabacteria bacterium]|nr:TatD family hydrolase [Candidatus Dadabacteria bacterium]MCZ6555602.1 TatD family hydrolase [Candidatus Dadabacteria bacterium]MCZ6790562.1 TatD family hydrolase [Candidatus Dadabacteria bacterium]MCZ6865065.1 TatD family hydrolase [Candidatus Dadabacteria bacterium]
MLIDSHAHLVSLENLPEVLQRAQENNINKIVSISSDIPSTEATISLAEEYDYIFATTGVHPHSADQMSEEVLIGIDHFAENDKVVAIGETGLDYFYMNSEKEVQIDSFTEHIRLGKKHDLPIIIHVRDAHEDMIEILSNESMPDTPGVIHCFTGDYDTAKKYLDLGFYISFSGIVTYKRSEELREAAKKIPKDKILIETDSPYLAPVPHRGKPNEPSYVKHVAETISNVRGISFDEIAEITKANAEKLFRI